MIKIEVLKLRVLVFCTDRLKLLGYSIQKTNIIRAEFCDSAVSLVLDNDRHFLLKGKINIYNIY